MAKPDSTVARSPRGVEGACTKRGSLRRPIRSAGSDRQCHGQALTHAFLGSGVGLVDDRQARAGDRRQHRHRQVDGDRSRRARSLRRHPLAQPGEGAGGAGRHPPPQRQLRRRSTAGRLLVARRGAPPRRRGARALPAAGRLGEQRGPHLGAPRRERRRLRAHVRRQPSRSVPAHQSAAGSHRGVGAGADRHGVVARPPALGDRLRRPRRAPAAIRRWMPTGAPSSPTCCSRASWRAGSRAPGSPPTACTRAWCAPTSARAATSAG